MVSIGEEEEKIQGLVNVRVVESKVVEYTVRSLKPRVIESNVFGIMLHRRQAKSLRGPNLLIPGILPVRRQHGDDAATDCVLQPRH